MPYREKLRAYAQDRRRALRDRRASRSSARSTWRTSTRSRGSSSAPTPAKDAVRAEGRRALPRARGRAVHRAVLEAHPGVARRGAEGSRDDDAATRSSRAGTTSALQREVTLVRWGIVGQPVLLFPTAGGDAEEIERFQMIDALAPLLDAGKIKVYSCDSVAGQALLDARGLAAAPDVAAEPVPPVRAPRGRRRRSARTASRPTSSIWAAGASIGAFHAVAVVCRFPDVFTQGARDERHVRPAAVLRRRAARLHRRLLRVARRCTSCRRSPGRHLDVLRTRYILIASGEGKAEDIGESWAWRTCSGRQGIPNCVDSWGPDWHHDWVTWREMLPQYSRRVDSDAKAVETDDDAGAQGRRRRARRRARSASSCARSSRTCARSSACSPRSRFEPASRRIGAEQEMFLIDRAWQPARGVAEAAREAQRPALHHRARPVPARDELRSAGLRRRRALAQMHAQLDDLVDRARKAARRSSAWASVLMGILPTMRKTDLGLENMVPSPRYLHAQQDRSPGCAAASSRSRSRASTS